MVRLNSNFNNLKKNYLFVEMDNRTKKFKSDHSDIKVINLGIGDVTFPLCEAVTVAMHDAVDKMSDAKTFKGYGPYEGYEFLRKAISDHYKKFGVKINASEIYVSDGAKSDTANIQDIFSGSGDVLISNPTYPAYVDSSIIRGKNILYIDANEENKFLPEPDYSINADLIYLCSPNNPTGAVYNKIELKKWVDYAIFKNSLILFDAAYEAFIEDKELPHSIFEVDGAKQCAIEICSFSKNAGFTGVRCGYMVIPNELTIEGKKVGEMWMRRQAIKFNGTSYITQCGAAAVFSDEGQSQIKKYIDFYKENAKIFLSVLEDMNIWHVGGKNSPYIWFKCPRNIGSWDFFDFLLKEANLVGTPGVGFGNNGEGFFRLSAFGSREDINEAAKRFSTLKI